MPHVLGIDAGGLGRPSWLAFLEGSRITLDQHVVHEHVHLLPWLQDEGISCIAVDAPQGLARDGGKVRRADILANTPVRRLPADRAEMAAAEAADSTPLVYIGLIRTGVEVFWANRDEVLGIASAPRLVETYPRAIFRTLTSEYPPSKTKEPFRFSAAVCGIMRRLGLKCPGVWRPSVDQCDAILCAIAARAFVEERAKRRGDPPIVDEDDRLLREGYIVLPRPACL